MLSFSSICNIGCYGSLCVFKKCHIDRILSALKGFFGFEIAFETNIWYLFALMVKIRGYILEKYLPVFGIPSCLSSAFVRLGSKVVCPLHSFCVRFLARTLII